MALVNGFVADSKRQQESSKSVVESLGAGLLGSVKESEETIGETGGDQLVDVTIIGAAVADKEKMILLVFYCLPIFGDGAFGF
jgi:hypothetical protein